jgi:FtsX-like permease family protein
MIVVLSWLRLEFRRRWRSLAVLALLVAISAGVVITSLAAARRGASVVHRLESRTQPATVAVLPNQPGFDWTKVQQLPEVAALSTFVVDYGVTVDGIGGDSLGFPPADDGLTRTLETPVVFSGRLFDPTRADEAVVTRRFVSHYHKGVGSTVVLHLPTARQLADSFTGQTPRHLDGPALTVRIVGVVVSPWISDTPDSHGGLQISPGVVAKYPSETVGVPGPDNTQFINALVRLKAGGADIPRFNDDLRRITGRADIGSLDLVQQARDIQHHVAFESRCLVAFAGAAFIAALFLVGQAVARYAAASTTELRTLQALGMTPRQLSGAAAVAPGLAGVAGAVLGAVAAWLASSSFPFGTAKLLEPSPGRQWDWWFTLPGIALISVLVTGGAALAARLALGAARREGTRRRSAVATAIGRAGGGVPVVVGARFALETGRGRAAIPVRPALVGAVMGVLGVVAAFTFSRGVSDASSHPERYGQTFQVGAFLGINGQDFGPSDKVTADLAKQPEVVGVDDARTAVANAANGRDDVALWEYEPGPKPMRTVVLDGRMPVDADEVLFAPRSMSALHTHVGATVTLIGSTGAPRVLRVVGSGFVPIGPHNNYSDGGWVSKPGYNALFKDFKFHLTLVALKPGVSPAKMTGVLMDRLNKSIPELDNGADVETGQLPTEIAEIREVRTLPIVLGGFLALLAAAAVGHALATAVRRRSHDLAVLRAVGMTPWQCRWVVITQASVLALVGLVFGVPIGLALGRTVWRVVADYTPMQYVAPIAATAMLLAFPAALLLANLLAAWPGRRAARLRIATVLRAE